MLYECPISANQVLYSLILHWKISMYVEKWLIKIKESDYTEFGGKPLNFYFYFDIIYHIRNK